MKKADKSDIIDFLNFLDNSPTSWHAVANCVSLLTQHGFCELKEEDAWHLKPGGCYFVKRRGSSLIAFVIPKKRPTAARIIASHSDSPALKLKPSPEFIKENMLMLGLEVYGSPLLTSWLNRDLGIAGRVITLDKKGNLQENIVRLDTSPVVIPQLAIHLDRKVNDEGLVINKQEQLAALAGIVNKKSQKNSFLERLLESELNFKELLGFDLFLYPLEKARLLGEEQTLISSYRIDNLEGVHASLKALLRSMEKDSRPSESELKMIVVWDHEEIGSGTPQGAGSPFFSHIQERIALGLELSREDYLRLNRASFLVSVDLAHGVHPNYSDRHEPRHMAIINEGIAIKSNAQQRYATCGLTSTSIKTLCRKAKIPYQDYLSRGDIPCGSTVGPIHASLTGMPTVDIGCPQLSMHSCREIMGTFDHLAMIRLLEIFLTTG